MARRRCSTRRPQAGHRSRRGTGHVLLQISKGASCSACSRLWLRREVAAPFFENVLALVVCIGAWWYFAPRLDAGMACSRVAGVACARTADIQMARRQGPASRHRPAARRSSLRNAALRSKHELVPSGAAIEAQARTTLGAPWTDRPRAAGLAARVQRDAAARIRGPRLPRASSMRLSRFHLATVKEVPADAEIVSHQLMLRAGMMRKLAAGIYTWSPLGLRVLRKVEAVVREEMNRAGAIELLMPSVQPNELWDETGPLGEIRRAAAQDQGPQGRLSTATARPTRKSSPISRATSSRATSSCRSTSTRSRPSSATRSARASASCARANS